MGIDYVDKIGSFVTILQAHNTSTATPDLSASLTTRVQNIYNDDPAVRGLDRIDRGPAIFVSMNRASEEETQIGDFNNRRKQKTVVYDVHGVYPKEGISKTHASVLTDFYQLASNLEAVVKRESTFSGSAIHVEVVDTDFKAERPENNFVKVFRIQVNARYFYQ